MKFISGNTPDGDLFAECSNGNKAARACANVLYRYIDWLDNIIDKDVPMTAAFSSRVSLDLMLTLAYNEFWLSNRFSLAPLLTAGFNSWLDSESLKGNKDYRMRVAGDVLKGYFMEVFYHIAFLTGGVDSMRKVSARWRGFDFDAAPENELPAIVPRKWSFPEDHEAHAEHVVEWWYFSGRVNEGAKSFGYHVCQFRIGEKYVTHASLFDIQTGKLISGEGDKLEVLDFALPGLVTIKGNAGSISFELELKHHRAQMLQGENETGYSPKSARRGHASHYYSIPHCRTLGWIEVEGVKHQVEGVTWFDHEFGNLIPPDGHTWAFFYAHFGNGDFVNGYLLAENGKFDPQYSRLIQFKGGVFSDLSKKIEFTGRFPTQDDPNFSFTVDGAELAIGIAAERPESIKTSLGKYLEIPCEVYFDGMNFDGASGLGYLEIAGKDSNG